MAQQPVLTCLVLAGFLALPTFPQSCKAGDVIEAIPGKEYLLTPQRGPWMIMVATFHTTGADGQTVEGKTPDQAADELVLELRSLGLPAYKFVYEPEQETITTTDLNGREEVRKNLRRVRTVCVLGGNYHSLDERVAQESLEWVKRLYPKCLREGVVFRPSKSRPGPLSAAFLTLNPLRSPHEVSNVVSDELLLRLNSGENYSLFENPGTYTLVVARFVGKSKTVGHKYEENAAKEFLNLLSKDVDLDDAAASARELVTVLRGEYDVSESKKFNNVEAYVWHDRYESLVTVGSFDSINDPRIQTYLKIFGPHAEPPPVGSGNVEPAYYGVRGFGKNGDQIRLWTFEAKPYLIKVPRTR